MTVARPILLVEDVCAQREDLARYLAMDNEFAVTTAVNLSEANALLAAPHARFDAILLNPVLTDGDSCDFCAGLRRQDHNMPIIIVTSASSEADVVRGLDAGANDYIISPFRQSELLARLRAQLRVFDRSDDAVFTIGHYDFRPSAKLLQDPLKNRRLRLTEKETAILKFLYHAGARAVARPALLEHVWGYNPQVTTHTLETHIYRLRQKIESNPGECMLLITESGGYRLNAAVAPAPSPDPASPV